MQDLFKTEYNQQLLLDTLKKNGCTIKRLKKTPLFIVRKKTKKELLFDISGSTTSFPAAWIAEDKYYTKKTLEHFGIPTPVGNVFNRFSIDDAIAYAERITFPVVVKPVDSGQGNYVFAQVDTTQELRQHISTLIEEYHSEKYFLIEKHVFGNEYRIFYTQNHFMAGVQRIPANVIGDGTHTLIQLIQIENYKRMNPRVNCLCEIKLDEILFEYLEKKQLDIDYLPKKDERVQLRPTSNISKGGNCIDITDSIHPSVAQLAQHILRAIPDLSVVGIDLICNDISVDLSTQEHWICELNPIPGLSLHTVPEIGKSRDTATAITELLFPNNL